jgi:hypothetical protein
MKHRRAIGRELMAQPIKFRIIGDAPEIGDAGEDSLINRLASVKLGLILGLPS